MSKHFGDQIIQEVIQMKHKGVLISVANEEEYLANQYQSLSIRNWIQQGNN